MTFLIFLISVAVLEYILRRPDADGEDPRRASKTTREPIEAPSVATGAQELHNLSHVLEQHGRGVAPEIRSAESPTKDTTQTPS